MNKPDLILFAKQPLPGQVKSRLQPQYTPTDAASIAAFLIRATVELAVSIWPGRVYLYASPNPDHALFHELEKTFRITLVEQTGGDLGAKMCNALRDGILRKGSAAVMGCDVPHCGRDVLDQAHRLLIEGKDVIGPTDDGGYYLIGSQRARPELFEGIEWGGDKVLAATLACGKKLGIEFELLPKLRDIDTAEDLHLVAERYKPLRQFL